MRWARIAVGSLVLGLVRGGAAASTGAVTWIVKGGGFGHGVGLSAYGAYGFGKHGSSYRQILGHYFRGIELTRMSGAPLVRVLLTTRSGEVSFSRATRACGEKLDPGRSYRARPRGSSVRL